MKEQGKNVGIWVRVSTDMQVEGESPELHLERGRMYANAKGWNVVTIYRLDALSGKSIMEYSETKRMLKDIQNGTITGLIFSKLARLARNTKELLEIAELFRESEADLISLAEAIDTSTPAGRLFFTIIAAMAQWEREEISARVAASVPIRAKMGKPTGGAAPFGYKWENQQLIIDEKEAPIRKLMYEIFAKLKRKEATAKELNRLGHRTRNGSLFSDNAVDRLIRDTTAKGVRTANYTKSLGDGKPWVLKPESEWVTSPCPAIVSVELWEECNGIIENITKRKDKLGKQSKYLLAGYVYCKCGKKMYPLSNLPVYKCVPCKRKIHIADLDEIYLAQLKSFLLADTETDVISGRANEEIGHKESLLKGSKDEYQKLKKRLEAQFELRTDGEISKEDFAAFYKPNEQRLRQLETSIPELEADIDFLKIQAASSSYIQSESKSLYENWQSLPFIEQRSIIETITERIEIQDDSISIRLSYQPTHPPKKEAHTSSNQTLQIPDTSSWVATGQ